MLFKLYGKVREEESGIGVPNLVVKAIDKDFLFDDLLGATTTDEDGDFEIVYEGEDYEELFDKGPDIYLKIKTPDRKKVIYSTEENVRFESDKVEEFTINIPRKLLDEINDIVEAEVDVHLMIDLREFVEILQAHDRMVLTNWLGQQRIEGPDVSMSLAEYIWSETQGIEELELGERVNRMLCLHSKLLGLPIRDFSDIEKRGKKHLGNVLHADDTLDLVFGLQKWYNDLKYVLPPPPPTKMIQIQHRRYKKSDAPYTINPGRIGPNFIHSWALDLVDVKAFRFPMKGWGPIRLYTSKKWGDDKLTVIDSCNRVLQTFTSTYDFQTKIVDLQKFPPCQHDANHPPYTRIYLVLETSRDPLPGAHRAFKVDALEHLTALSGTERAYVVADEINYDYFDTSIQPPNNNDFIEALDRYGNPIQIYPPWSGGPQGINTALSGRFKVKPSADNGWYLFGVNTTYADQDFFSVVYYNERKAILRIYLYNLSHAIEHTANVVRVYFEGCLNVLKEDNPNPDKQPKLIGEFKPLKGAFFPVDPNPKNWWHAELVVSAWKPNSWTAVDVPVLFPMGSNLPAVGDFNLGSAYLYGNNPTSSVGAEDLSCKYPNRTVTRYRSIYEDKFAANQRNVRLVISVRTFEEGYCDFKLVAEAVGEVVQQKKSQWDKIVDAYQTGKDWYGYADAIGSWINDKIENKIKASTGPAKNKAQEVQKQLKTGFSVIGWVARLLSARSSSGQAYYPTMR